MPARNDFSGPALFSYGFRPFFLAATLFALVAVPVWLLAVRGAISLGGVLSPVDWHSHEMIYGYGSAVVAGFLFTAVPNWTGRMPTRGWPLLVLSALWLIGRLAVAGLLGLNQAGVLIVDQAFLLAVAAMIAREIVAGRNWRNLKVVIPVTVFWAANVAFHLEAMTAGVADLGRRLGIAVLIFLIMLIGGRIVPSFTRNWLVQRGSSALPNPFDRVDAAALVTGAVALGSWAALPVHPLSGAMLCLAGGLHFVRLTRWRGMATWHSPLLLMLHAAYLFVPLGLVASGLFAFGLLREATGVHILGIGAIGGMTVAVMIRATLGHTGRELVAGKLLAAAFVLLVAAAVWRLFDTREIVVQLDGISASALCWSAAFALVVWRLAPLLTTRSAARRAPTRPPKTRDPGVSGGRPAASP